MLPIQIYVFSISNAVLRNNQPVNSAEVLRPHFITYKIGQNLIPSSS